MVKPWIIIIMNRCFAIQFLTNGMAQCENESITQFGKWGDYLIECGLKKQGDIINYIRFNFLDLSNNGFQVHKSNNKG